MKTAILQVADTHPLESLVVMLESVGYQCFLPSEGLRNGLRRAGCDTVLSIDSLVKDMGYSRPRHLPETDYASVNIGNCDLFVDVKGHRNGPKIIEEWPRLKGGYFGGRILWYRINGGKPEHVIRRNSAGEVIEDCGDECYPFCPVLTPNQWYKDASTWFDAANYPKEVRTNPGAYTCWPPFFRFKDYASSRNRSVFSEPLCLIHNLQGWGYGRLVGPFRDMGIRMYGRGSPDGLLPNSRVRGLLSIAKCMVHLKSSDAPGYALYEAMAAGCPVICTRRLIWRCKMQDLLIPEETCLVFDRETHEGLTEDDVLTCTTEVYGHLKRLEDPTENRRIGEGGRKRLQEVMWSDKKEEDVKSFREFMTKHFPG